MRWAKRLGMVLVLLFIIYLAGPKPSTPVYDTAMPALPGLQQLDSFVAAGEAAHRLRPNNEARIVWANNTVKQKTPYSIVYLHGFAASQEEGNPVHRYIAKRFGCNLYLARLAEHGMDTTEQLIRLTADKYWESARQALAIGRQLGDRVIIMGTSTGATQALQLAATYPSMVSAIVLYSPNIAINDPNAWVLNNHWGLQIARLVTGGNYIVAKDDRPVYRQYWSKPYRLEAAVALEEMLETTMNNETFQKIKQPTLLLYYYKDEQHQDAVVKVSAMKEMFASLGTPASLKREMALPNTANHVIASPIKSADVGSVEKETARFIEEVLLLKPVTSP